MEYIFHRREPEGMHQKPMSAAKLQQWYERMLSRATELGIVKQVVSLQEHLNHLTSVRDFPVFEGDFFPDRLPEIIEKASEKLTAKATTRAGARGGGGGGSKKPGKNMRRMQSLAIAADLKLEVTSSKWSFLVGDLNAASGAAAEKAPKREKAATNELVDSRMRFLETSVSRHWQFDDLRRAHWSTMMILANLGGAPDAD
jgi:hypothetical protein